MRDTPLHSVLAFLQSQHGSADTPPDAELLQRYVEQQDQAAFSEIVRRHGPMVYGVCRRGLGHGPDAEDAFQTTFIALARQAHGIRTTLAGWLYRVAYRQCLRSMANRHDALPVEESAPAVVNDSEQWEVRRILDEEIEQLPDSLRMPVILCLVVGRSREQAAQELGVSRRTLFRRLEAGRRRLQQRLIRRGLGTLVAAIGCTTEMLADIRPDLLRTTCQLAQASENCGPLFGMSMPNQTIGRQMMKPFLLMMLVTTVGLIWVVYTPTDRPEVAAQGVTFAPKLPPPRDGEEDKEARAAIDRASQALLQKADENGIWNAKETTQVGSTHLIVLALLEAGIAPDHPVLKKAIAAVQEAKNQHVYNVSLKLQVLLTLNDKGGAVEKKRIEECVDWLEKAIVFDNNGKFVGWSYASGSARADGSNSRFALVALHQAHHAGFKVGIPRFWQSVREAYLASRCPDDSWGYVDTLPKGTLSMTLSGILALQMVESILKDENQDSRKAIQVAVVWLLKQKLSSTSRYYTYELLALHLSQSSVGIEAEEQNQEKALQQQYRQMILESQKTDGTFPDEYAPLVTTAQAIRFLVRLPKKPRS